MISEPDRPEGPLLISNVEADSVHLSWKPPANDNGGLIQGYIIEAKDVLHMDVRKMQIWSEGQETECTVRNLETSHIYQFRVYAQNEAGRSEGLLNKTLVRIKAKSKKPPRPSKPTAEPQGNDSVLLKWSVTEVDGQEDLNFLIERFEPKSDLWFQCNRQLVTVTSFLVTGLSWDREYKFRVSSENQYGVSRPSVETDAIRLNELQGEAPYVLVPLRDCYIRSNDRAVFRCEYAGSVPIQVQWTKDGLRVSENFGASIKTECGKYSELDLAEVDSDDDECPIQCSLKNAFGRISTEAKIRTLSPPQLRCPSSYSEGLTYDVGDILRLRVTVTGRPAPDLKWLFNDGEPSVDETVQTFLKSDSIEIHIDELRNEHAGNYKFVARNEMGEDFISVKVTISGLPDPPAGHLWFDLEENDEVTLNWNPPLQDGGSEIFSYQVEKSLPGCSEWLRISSTHKMSMDLGLSQELESTCFRVKAINIYGTGAPSKELKFEKDLIWPFENKPSNSTQKGLIEECIVSEANEATTKQWSADEGSVLQLFPFKSKLEERIDTNASSMNKVDLNETVSQSHVPSKTQEPSLFFAVIKTESFSEVTYFCNENILAIQLTCHLFEELHYTSCCSSIIFESLNLIHENSYPEKFSSISYVLQNNYLEIFEPLVYNQISSFNTQQNFEEETGDCKVLNTINILYESHHEHLIVTSHPFVFDDTILFVPFTKEKQNCLCIINCYKAIAISLNQVNETVSNYKNKKSYYSSAVAQIQTNVESEKLVNVLPMPVTTYKPAMSVLPIRREIQKIDETRSEPSSSFIYSSKATLYKETMESFKDTCEFKDHTEADDDLLSYLNSYIMEQDSNKTIFSNQLNDTTETTSETGWMLPNWLMNVSPAPASLQTPIQVDASVCKFNMKEKSVQELLQLAEEVERSFSQKAEQIESLESVLQEELTSLEKDLETVNEIHRSLNSSYDAIESEHFDSPIVKSYDPSNSEDVPEFMHKDLIELNDDVPLIYPRKAEHNEYAPQVIVHLQNRIVQCGNRTRLYCSITGDPYPEIFWTKNGKSLPSSSRYMCNNLEEYGLYIDIFNAKSTDSGEYSCIATNPLGSVSSQAYLQVIGKRENSPEEPTFLKAPEDLSVKAGETVVLEWNFTAMPFPSIIWFKNAEKIHSSLRIDTFNNHRGLCRLVIRDVDADDGAIYSCYLENDCGSAVSTILLSVTEGKASKCHSYSEDDALFRNQRILENEDYESQLYHERSSLLIDLPKHRLENYLKTKKTNDTLPRPPNDVRVLGVGQTWVLLSWNPPANERRTKLEYRVERRLLNSQYWKEVGRTYCTVYTAHGFKRGRSYVFRVSTGAKNGAWSLPTTLCQPVHLASK